ncbi:MlaD family protein [Nocardia higoensis]|uniref:MlaD family protein n=1 Tax=Nocardia higoensis TaxID=228599 RepID=UPI0002E4C719|nr:MlaD family protein [Nocardia higoensis]
MNIRTLTSLSAIAAVLVFGIAYMSIGVLHMDPRRDHITVDLRLDNSGGLGPGAPVLLNGIQVGRTESVRTQASGVLARLRIDDRYRIPANGEVHVDMLSALGEPYVGFEPDSGAGPYLEDGQVVSADRIRMPATITALSTRLVELLDQVRPEVMANLVATFDRALAGTDAAVQTLQRSTALLAATLLSRTGTLRQLFDDMQAMGGDIDWMGPSLAVAGPLFGEFGVTLSAIVQNGSVLVESRPPSDYFTGDGVAPFLTEVEALLREIGPDIAPLGPMLAPVVTDAVARMPDLDIGALLDQALNTVEPDGALRFRITLK